MKLFFNYKYKVIMVKVKKELILLRALQKD